MTGNVKGLFYGSPGQLGCQVIDIAVGFAWAWGVTWLIFSALKRYKALRVSPEVELEGLDMAEFGALCYPDFVLASETPGIGEDYEEPEVQAGLGSGVRLPTDG